MGVQVLGALDGRANLDIVDGVAGATRCRVPRAAGRIIRLLIVAAVCRRGILVRYAVGSLVLAGLIPSGGRTDSSGAGSCTVTGSPSNSGSWNSRVAPLKSMMVK